MFKIRILIPLILISLNLEGQNNSNIYLSDLLLNIIESDSKKVQFSASYISNDNLPTIENQWGKKEKMSVATFLKSYYPHLKIDSSGRIAIDKQVTIKVDSLNVIELSNLRFSSLVLEINYGYDLLFHNVHFDTLDLTIHKLTHHFFFREGSITKGYISTKSTVSNNLFWIHTSEISRLETELIGIDYAEFMFNEILLSDSVLDAADSTYFDVNDKLLDYTDNGYHLLCDVQSVQNLTLWGNKTSSSSPFNEFNGLTFMGDLDNLKILENELAVPLNFVNLTINQRLEIIKNHFTGYKGLGLYRTLFPELLVNIDWNQFQNKLYNLTDASMNETYHGYAQFGILPYFGESLKEMTHYDRYRNLLASYSKFYHHYKEVGDIEAANSVYRELQDLHTLMFQYRAISESSLNNTFKWRLNQLLKFYTEYGTNPIRSVIISLYLIFGFAIFYFFFPSEWDKESKTKTLQNLKLAIKKNQTPFISAFIRSLRYFVISLINAVTLSVNSFVTLGFGTIPTKGLARYVCILQGFLGWFLLSLFLVALFNQVNF